jgi:PAS domain-containing protein
VKKMQDALAYAETIIATLREPFLVLDKGSTVKTANDSFYETFHVPKEETEGRSLYGLGDGQWDIPGLRTLLEKVAREVAVHDFEVEHDFPEIGRTGVVAGHIRLVAYCHRTRPVSIGSCLRSQR